MFCPHCGAENGAGARQCRRCNWELGDGTGGGAPPPLATLGERLLGQTVDSMAVAAAILVTFFFGAVSDEEVLSSFLLIGAIVLALAYLLLADGLEGGQSYGKRVMKIAVVDAKTLVPCTFGQSFIRNLLLMAIGLFDWVFIFGERRQRLGDKAAGTIVIKVDQPRTA